MKAKDLLIALKTDAEGGLESLSAYKSVFLQNEEAVLTKIDYDQNTNRVYLTDEKTQPMTLNEFVQQLNQYKEASLYIQKRPIYGYRLTPQGIIVG